LPVLPRIAAGRASQREFQQSWFLKATELFYGFVGGDGTGTCCMFVQKLVRCLQKNHVVTVFRRQALVYGIIKQGV